MFIKLLTHLFLSLIIHITLTGKLLLKKYFTLTYTE